MIFGVMRHAKAEPAREGLRDEERRLTEEGRRQVEALARVLPWRPRVIVHSPLARARETAEILAGLLGVGEVVESELLRPDRMSVEALRSLAGDGVLLVGHAPSVEEALSGLLGCRVRLKTASVAIVRLESGRPELLALITPPGTSLP